MAPPWYDFTLDTSFFLSSLQTSCSPWCFAGEEDWGRRVWGDLRGSGSAEPNQRGLEGGVCSAAQAGLEDGGGRAQKASR